jgi:AcrR family transcriptional regulator
MSPRTEEANQRIREEQKQRILAAATTLFAHRGFSDTKMTDIAAAAEVSYGLAYHYFANKEEIFTRLVEWALSGALDMVQRAMEQAGTPWDRIHWLTSQMLTGLQGQPEIDMVVIHALTNDTVPPEIRELALQLSNMIQDLLKRLIIEGQAAGQVVSGDPDRLATLFGSCIQGLALGRNTFFHNPPFSFPDTEDVLRILRA